MLQKLGSTAVANLLNGLILAVFQLAMTAIVSRQGGANEIKYWAIAASLAGLAPLLACNFSVVVAKNLALDRTTLDQHTTLTAAETIIRRLFGMCASAFVAMLLILPFVYQQASAIETFKLTITVVIYCVGACWIVKVQATQGWLLYYGQNWRIAWVNLALRFSALAVFSVFVFVFASPIWTAVIGASAVLWLGPWLMRSVSEYPKVLKAETDELKTKDMLANCASFGVWGLTTAASQTLTIPIVAIVASELVAPAFLAISLVSIQVSALVAIGNALIAPLAKLHAKSDRKQAGETVLKATLAIWIMNAGMILFTIIYLDNILKIWVGDTQHNLSTVRGLYILFATQHLIRNLAMPSSILLSMQASSKALVISPIIELVVCCLISIPVAVIWGVETYIQSLVVAGFLGAGITIALLSKNMVAEIKRNLLLLFGGLAVLSVAAYLFKK